MKGEVEMKRLIGRLKGNEGFTLVELLIATAVLAVIMVPLMRAFVVAANTMSSGVDHGKVTVAMENTVELIATSSFDSINDLGSAGDPDPGSVVDSLSLLAGYDGGAVTVRDFGSADYSRTGITEVMMTGSKSVGYTVEGADMAGGEGLVDVIITPIDKTAVDGDLAFNDMYDNVNSADYASFTAMDKTWLQTGLKAVSSTDTTVTVYQNEHVDFLAAKYLKNDAAWSTTDLANVQRTIQITIEDGTGAPDMPSGYDMVYYKVVYQYKKNGAFSYDGAVYENTLWDGYAFIGTDGVFSVQLVYLPLYGDTTDQIVISNTDNIDCKFFLIKQNMIDSTEATTLGFDGVKDSLNAFDQTTKVSSANDTNYGMDITLKENGGITEDGVNRHALRLFTNVYEHVFDGQTAPNPDNFTFTYGTTASTSLQEKLVDDSSGGRGYNILVRVYEKNVAGNYELKSELKTVKLM